LCVGVGGETPTKAKKFVGKKGEESFAYSVQYERDYMLKCNNKIKQSIFLQIEKMIARFTREKRLCLVTFNIIPRDEYKRY
jgi:hypothetical protein